MDRWQRCTGLFHLKFVCVPQSLVKSWHLCCVSLSESRYQESFDHSAHVWQWGWEKPICFVFTTLLPSFYSSSVPCAFLSFKQTFFSKLQHDGSFCQKNNNCVLQRRSCTRTTRRRPYIMTQTRMPIPENPNLTMASWSSTDPYAPPGASSVWSGIILTSFSPFLYIRDTDRHTVYTQGCVCGVLEC